jgi:hypothetical protein
MVDTPPMGVPALMLTLCRWILRSLSSAASGDRVLLASFSRWRITR